MSYYYIQTSNDHLAHHGVLGMRWGIRRYQPYAKGHKGGKEIGEAAKKSRTEKESTRDSRIKTAKKAAAVTAGLAIASVTIYALGKKAMKSEGMTDILNKSIALSVNNLNRKADAGNRAIDKLLTSGKLRFESNNVAKRSLLFKWDSSANKNSPWIKTTPTNMNLFSWDTRYRKQNVFQDWDKNRRYFTRR